MSINWVMLDTSSKSFVPLPREKILFASPNRTALTLQTPNSYPGREPLSIKCNDGKATITNQRVYFTTFSNLCIANKSYSSSTCLPIQPQPSNHFKPLFFLSTTRTSRPLSSVPMSGKGFSPLRLVVGSRRITISSKSSSHSKRAGHLISPRHLNGSRRP